MAKRWNTKPPAGSQINCGHPLSRGLVGCWLMNEGGGNKIIDIVQGINGDGVGNPSYSQGSFKFNGSSQYFLIPSIYNNKVGYPNIYRRMSIVACVRRNNTGSRSLFVGKADGNSATSSPYWLEFTSGDQARFLIGGEDAQDHPVASTKTITDTNKFHTFVGTYDFITQKLYIDGIQEPNTLTYSFGITNANVLFGIGRIGSYNGLYFNGYIKYVYLYNRALSPSEIQSLYVNPYQFITRPSRISVNTAATTSCALSGTVTSSITEADVVAGGKTIILTLGGGETWIAAGAFSFDLQRQNIIDGITSAQSETFGWNLVPKALQGVAGVVRTSDTVVTITLDAQPTYNITAKETITATVPATALVGNAQLVATPTFTVDPVTVGAGHYMSTNKGFW